MKARPVLWFAILCAVALAPATAFSDTITLTQLTDTSGPQLFAFPVISADGSMVAFQSGADLTGGNPDRSAEVFLVRSDGAGLTQLTSDPAYSSMRPSISADGAVVAFQSAADFTGGNADHSDEIFVVNADGSGLTQLTADPDYGSGPSCLSGDGSTVVFQSNADLTGANPYHVSQIFLVCSDGTGLTQLTADPAYDSLNPTISADGSMVAFQSYADFTGDNADNSACIFFARSDGTLIRQITSDPSYDTSRPAISADGSLVAFQSQADLTGQNPDNQYEIFVVGSDGTGLRQLSTDPDYGSTRPAISGDGSTVAFQSDADPTGTNADHWSEIFTIRTDGTGVTQVTSDPTYSSYFASVTADGLGLAFQSEADLTGGNGDDSAEVFAALLAVPNVAPTAAFSFAPPAPSTQDTIAFLDASTDPDGKVVSWAWDFGDGAASALQNPAHRYADDGAYTVTLTVTDNAGATGSAAQSVTVANVAPTAAFTYSPLSPSTQNTVAFSDASSDADGAIASWAWDFGDGTNSTDRNPSHRYADQGVYTVTLTVTDDDGAAATTSQPVSVANAPPAAAFSYLPAQPTTEDPVAFSDASTDADGDVVSWVWHFGDGATSTDEDPSHTYAADGTYRVSLTVTDNDGATGSVTRSVTVQPVRPSRRVDIVRFWVPPRAQAGCWGVLIVAVRNVGVVAMDVSVQTKRLSPSPPCGLGSWRFRLRPRQYAVVPFLYRFRTADAPRVTFQAIATPTVPGAQGDWATASTQVRFRR